MNILDLIGRDNKLFNKDIEINAKELASLIEKSSFLVIGEAGIIRHAVTKEILKKTLKKPYIRSITSRMMLFAINR